MSEFVTGREEAVKANRRIRELQYYFEPEHAESLAFWTDEELAAYLRVTLRDQGEDVEELIRDLGIKTEGEEK